MVFGKKNIFLSAAGFSAPPTSRPPTKIYDRQSFVLVVDEADDLLKFMKMHLNRYFSHVAIAKTATDGINFLKQRDFDLIVADGTSARKANDLIKKVAHEWRGIPVVLTSEDPEKTGPASDFSHLLVVDVVKKPLDMDELHVAIRRALNSRAYLKELSEKLAARTPLGTAVHAKSFVTEDKDALYLINKIKERLEEEIID